MGASRILLAGTVALLTAACTISEARTIKFSGYDWTVRAGRGGPGPNNWDENNVWVDQSGYLHLQLTSRGNQWYASEVSTTDRLGFGRYQFWVIGRLDRLDPQHRVRIVQLSDTRSRAGRHERNRYRVLPVGQSRGPDGQLHSLAHEKGACSSLPSLPRGTERRLQHAQDHLELHQRVLPVTPWPPRR